jgi:hypothetical protein
MQAAGTFKTLVTTYQTTRWNKTDDNNLVQPFYVAQDRNVWVSRYQTGSVTQQDVCGCRLSVTSYCAIKKHNLGMNK